MKEKVMGARSIRRWWLCAFVALMLGVQPALAVVVDTGDGGVITLPDIPPLPPLPRLDVTFSGFHGEGNIIPNPPYPAHFFQIGAQEHPLVGNALTFFTDFAGQTVSRTGSADIIRFQLFNNNTAGTLASNISITFDLSAPPGPGLPPAQPGVTIYSTPLQNGQPYPEIPYPNQIGNLFGWYRLNLDDAGGHSNPIQVLPQTSAFFQTQLSPIFPGAWRIGVIATDLTGVLPTQRWDIGGIAEPAATATGLVYSLRSNRYIFSNSGPGQIFGAITDNLGPNVPRSPSETRVTYRIYNTGAQPLNLASFTFLPSAGQVNMRVIEVRRQDGTLIPPVAPNAFGLPTLVPAYDGTYSPQGPLAYTGGSSPVAPWVEVVLGVVPISLGGFNVQVSANMSGSNTGYTWNISGQSVAAPEIEVLINGSNVVSDETVVSAGGLVNLVPGRGREYLATIRNIGTANMTLGPAFFVSTTAVGDLLPGGTWDGTGTPVIAPGANLTLRFRISPAVPDPPDSGPFAIELRIPNTDADENPFIIPIEGLATPRLPRLIVERNDRSIPNNGVDIETTVTNTATSILTYTLRNPGDRVLSIANPIVINGAVATSVATITGDLTPIDLDPVDPVTLAPGSTATFNLNVQALNALDSYRVPIRITSTSGSIDPGAANVHAFTVTDFRSDGGEGRECGFGSPFGLLLLIGGLLLWRRRMAA